MKKDKRFRPIKSSESKVQVDERFAGMRDQKVFQAQRAHLSILFLILHSLL